MMHQLISAIDESSDTTMSQDDGSSSSSGGRRGLPLDPSERNDTTTIAISDDSNSDSSNTRAAVLDGKDDQASTSSMSSPWREVVERCRTHPHEAAHLDRRGGSCLHAACVKNPPECVITAILQACRRTKTVLERDKSGRTPLMISISCNARLQVIETLLKNSQRAARVHDHLGNLPLHLACSRYHLRGESNNDELE